MSFSLSDNKKDELMTIFKNDLPKDYTNNQSISSIQNENKTLNSTNQVSPFSTLSTGSQSSNQNNSTNDIVEDNLWDAQNDSSSTPTAIFPWESNAEDADDDLIKQYQQKQGFITGDKQPYKIDTTDSNYTSQSEAFLQLIMGNNVFLSGPAGSGKSYIIDKYVDYVHKHSHKRVYVTSTTGLSALNIHGETIHSYDGQGISLEPFEKMQKHPSNIFLWKKSKKKILNTDILIIDEISMFSALQLEFLYKRLKSLLQERFNKVQVIVAGDFSQLPPVASKNAVQEYGEEARSFCYDTEAWRKFNFIPCYLDRIYRAKDTRLQKLLGNIADGDGERAESIRLLRRLKVTDNKFTKGVPTLVSSNREVNEINTKMQNDNPNQLYSNATIYDLDVTSKHLKLAHNEAKKMGYEDQLSLKVGDTVMITSNASEKDPFYLTSQGEGQYPVLKNGIIGTITSLTNEFNNEDTSTLTQVGFKATIDGQEYNYLLMPYKYEIDDVKGEKIAAFTQFPLRLAYAISIHKSQDQTFSKIAIDLKNTWMPGLGYVALSRATNYDSIVLINEKPGRAWNRKALLINRSSLRIRQDLLKNAYQLRQAYMPYYQAVAKDINFIFNNRDKLQLGTLLNASVDYANNELKELSYYQEQDKKNQN